MAKIGWTTITAPVVAGTHGGYVAQIKTGDVPASMLSASSNLINGGGNLIAFTDATMTTRLPLDIVSCVTGGSPELLVYARYDGSFITNSTIYLIADDTQVVQPAVGAAYGRNAVWSDYEAVIHANETGTDGVFVDSTGNGHDTTLFYGASLPTSSSGHPWSGTWPDFDFSQGLSVTSSSALINNTEFSISCWFSPDVSSQFDSIINNRFSSGSSDYIAIQTSSRIDTSVMTNVSTVNNGSLSTGVTYFRKITQTTSILRSYIDGVVNGSVSNPNSGNGESFVGEENFFIGSLPYSISGAMNGRVCEIRIKRSEDSPDYTSTEYDNQSSTTWFTNDGWTEGVSLFKPYWARLANNLISYN